MNTISIYLIFLNVVAISTLFISLFVASRYIKENGVKELIFMIIVITITSISSFSELITLDFETKLLWRNISQIGYMLITPATFKFVMKYSRVKPKFINTIGNVLVVFGTILVLLIFTNDLHHIMRVSVYLDKAGLLQVQQTVFGEIAVSILTFLDFIWLFRLIFYFYKTVKGNRFQVGLVLIGNALPLIYIVIRYLIYNNLATKIPLSIAFAVGYLFILIGMFKYGLFSVSPMGISWVLDELNAGIIYTDLGGNVFSSNKFVTGVFKELINVKQLDDRWFEKIIKRKDCDFEIRYEDRFYSIKLHILGSSGSVSLISDITESKLHNQYLTHIAEVDRMTNILNRESFINKVKSKLLNSNDIHSITIIDIDNFKKINDTYGHMTGDYVIKAVVDILKGKLRDSDLLGRLGGDEFILFIDKSDEDFINSLVDRIKTRLKEHDFAYDGTDFKCTLSFGTVLSSSKDFNSLYEKADKSLYTAKNSGRNISILTTF